MSICLRIGTPSSAVSQTRLWLAFSLRRRCGKLNVDRFEQLVLSRMMALCERQHASRWPPRTSCEPQHALCAQQHASWYPPHALCGQQHALWCPPRSLLLRAQRPKLRRNDMAFSVDSRCRAGKGRRPAAALICALPEELRAEGKRPYGEIIERGPCQRAVLLSASIIVNLPADRHCSRPSRRLGCGLPAILFKGGLCRNHGRKHRSLSCPRRKKSTADSAWRNARENGAGGRLDSPRR